MENKIISTNTYRVEIPASFSEHRGKYEYFSVWNPNEKFVTQFPIMNMALSEISDLEEAFEGVDYQEKVYNYFATKRANITKTEKEEIEIAGKNAYVQRAISVHERAGQPLTIFSMFINVPLNETVMLEFSADCEIDVQSIYEPLFLQTIEGVELLGDYVKYLQIYNDKMDQFLDKLDKLEKLAEGLETNIPVESEEPLPAMPVFEIPEDGKDIFKIGDYNLEMDTKKSAWEIGSFSNILTVTIAGSTNQIAEGVEAKLWDDYPGDGKVSISFEAKGIYHPDGPEGVFEIEEDKCIAPYLYLRTTGFDYALKFYGKVTFAKKWVGFTGYLKPSYESKPCFLVNICKQLDPEVLDWTEYQFQSMKETEQIAVEQVRFLSIDELFSEKLPERLYTFKNLEKLNIQEKTLTKLSLNEISPKIGQLKELKTLRINHASLETLPKEIGHLKNLTEFSIHRCLLATVPATIWQLPRLENLSFAQNRLTEIPADLNLPELKFLSLDDNQLTNLPDSVASLPNLVSLNLENNPWEKLPAKILEVSRLSLAYHQKKQLFDFTYRGADGAGLVDWDDQIYYAQYDAELAGQITDLIEKNELQKYAAGLAFWVKKAVGFTQQEKETYQKLGNHRFGGMPDLPQDVSYPRYGEDDLAYEFIAQINCNEIAKLQDYLPRTGMLYFFLTTIHDIYHGNDSTTAKVIYHPNVSGKLTSGKGINLATTDYYEMFDLAYQGYQVTAKKINSCPAFYPIMQNLFMFRGPAADLHAEEDFLDNDAYDLFEEPMAELNSATHMINGYGFTQHEYPELSIAQTHRGNPEDWTVLLEVDSAGDMQWGDAGTLFYVIHKSDLKRGDFSNVFCTMYSS